MSRTDDRANIELPVTAEVGGEGGSFADPTTQVATFHGREPRRDLPMEEGHQPAGAADAASGLRRYPTEPPGPRTAPTAPRPAVWRAGMIGAAAGAAAGAAVAFRFARRRS